MNIRYQKQQLGVLLEAEDRCKRGNDNYTDEQIDTFAFITYLYPDDIGKPFTNASYSVYRPVKNIPNPVDIKHRATIKAKFNKRWKR